MKKKEKKLKEKYILFFKNRKQNQLPNAYGFCF